MQKAEEVKKIRDELKTQGFMLSEQARTKKEAKFRKLGKELERYSEDRRAEFVSIQKGFGPSLKKSIFIIANISRSRCYRINMAVK